MSELVHIRVVVPEHHRTPLVDLLVATEGVTNVAVLAGAAVDPRGDLVLFDVAREVANEVLAALEREQIDHLGSIVLIHSRLSLGDSVDAALAAAPGEADTTVLWSEVEDAVRTAYRTTARFFAYFVVASLIAAAGVLTNSPILIVGAMVVGPEYGAIAAMSWALERRHGRMFLHATLAGVAGSMAAVLASAVFAGILRAFDRLPDGFELSAQTNAGFIAHPDVYSGVVACAAAVAGVLSLAFEHSGTLVGVLVSVTTIPAIAAIGVGAVTGDWHDVAGAARQLGVNVAALTLMGAITFRVLRTWPAEWHLPGWLRPWMGRGVNGR
ncbi:MAG: DUF389 domain-containing protein [Ilumatobacteraceae bacterium]|nr:DUF389 domain-containing protein [Ilumatobacter sp.]MCB0984340.1 DUF389 domain-containing protein [Ilumatobacter sp.]